VGSEYSYSKQHIEKNGKKEGFRIEIEGRK
jgi:hypothetical protein